MSNKLYKNNAVILKQTDSYNDLKNSTKPMINSIMLEGNKTSDELNMYTKDQINQLIAQVRNVRYTETIPSNPQANTLYYVGTAKPYNVYLYIEDSSTGTLTRLDMGTTEIDLTEYQKSQDNNLQTTSKNIVGAINENKTNIGQKQNITDNTLITTNKTIVTAINEIETDINKLPNTYAPLEDIYYHTLLNSRVSVNDCVFNMIGTGTDNGYVTGETRSFACQVVDPITNTAVDGVVKTEQYVANGANISIVQTFTRYQIANFQQNIVFRRKGYYQASSGSSMQNVYDNRASIVWKDWYPLEYPITITSPTSNYSGYVHFTINGGIMLIEARGVTKTGGSIVFDDIISVLPDLPVKVDYQVDDTMIDVEGTNSRILQFRHQDKNLIGYNVPLNISFYGSVKVPLGY